MPARLADLVNLHDVRVLQPCHRLGLDPEARQLPRPGMAAAEDHLERHGAFEGQVQRLVDDAHAPTADYSLDLVARHQNPSRSTLRLRARRLGALAR
jgi:hypothetical protein